MKSVAVYCGSKRGGDVYVQAAMELGQVLVESGIQLVYGGGRVGLMGVVADTVMNLGGSVVGVIPKFLNIKEIENQFVTELHVVETMHERKKIMADRADAAIVLPGGFGTLDECFEFVTWSQVKLHDKLCGLLNINGYYDKLIEFLEHTTRENFIHPDHRTLLVTEREPAMLVQALRKWSPGHKEITAYELI